MCYAAIHQPHSSFPPCCLAFKLLPYRSTTARMGCVQARVTRHSMIPCARGVPKQYPCGLQACLLLALAVAAALLPPAVHARELLQSCGTYNPETHIWLARTCLGSCGMHVCMQHACGAQRALLVDATCSRAYRRTCVCVYALSCIAALDMRNRGHASTSSLLCKNETCPPCFTSVHTSVCMCVNVRLHAAA